jgi:hypothetical protein
LCDWVITKEVHGDGTLKKEEWLVIKVTLMFLT